MMKTDMEIQTATAWQPISDLPLRWHDLAITELPPLFRVWRDQVSHLRHTNVFKTFMNEMRREIAIETGIIERLYSLDRGITQLLIEHGFDESLIPHGASDKPPRTIIEMIRDQDNAVEGLFDFVSGKRTLSTSYIKELHATLTQHQDTTDAIAPDGRPIDIQLLRGDWKRQPNNPLRPDGTVHQYCPPEHVGTEMDNLVRWHLAHVERDIPPEIQAAWLHHRFTQIHPFQDGNGRVARCLATLIFIQHEWFPLVIRDVDRGAYILCLEQADAGDLAPLIGMFAQAERQAFIRGIGLSEGILDDHRQTRAIIGAVGARIQKQRESEITVRIETVERYAAGLFDLAARAADRVRGEINGGLKIRRPNGKPIADVFCHPNRSKHADWRGWQINQTAKQLGYYANRRDYSAWLQLRIHYEPVTDILFSFHVPGPKYVGVLVCLASAFRNSESDEGHLVATDLEPLSHTPFQFSYADDEEALRKRFEEWLDSTFVAGLHYWQREV